MINRGLLSIRDWVSLSKDVEHPVYARVAELHTDEVLVQIPGENACDIWGYEDIYPVPLTADILYWNGFVETKPFGKGFANIKAGIWLTGVPNGDRYMYTTEISGSPIAVPHVHGLQRILRSVGGLDIADGFKIY